MQRSPPRLPKRASRPRGSDPADGFALWRLGMRWQRAIDAALRPVRLTHTQYLLLWSAHCLEQETGDAVMQRAIARASGLDEATTSRLVGALEERGLLDRGPTHGDGRIWRVIVTKRGQGLLGRATPRVRQACREFFSSTGPGDEAP